MSGDLRAAVRTAIHEAWPANLDHVPGCEQVKDAASALIPEDAVLVTEAERLTLEKAHAIGSASYDGDSWFAKDAGYDYEDAEATMSEAAAILRRLREGTWDVLPEIEPPDVPSGGPGE